MKIAFIGQKGIPTKQGGIEKHVEELAVRLAQAHESVTVYAREHYTGNRHSEYKNVNLIYCPSINTKNLDAISHTLFSSLHAIFQNYNVIHYHGVGPALLSWIPRLLAPKTKVVVTFHCQDKEHQKWGHFAKLMLAMGEWAACHFPHETIVISKGLQKYVKTQFNREATYIPNGVNISPAKNSSHQIAILNKYGLEKQKYFVLVSRLVQHKGVHTLIDAYQKIKTDKKLVIVGGGSNTDEYVSYLHRLAVNNPNIIFTGSQSGNELNTLFTNAYLFVQPSEAEGLSIALLEAMAYEIPVIVSDIPENLEATGDYSLSFKNKSGADLTKQLVLADTDHDLITDLARKAKIMVDKDYNWDDIAHKTIIQYQNLIAKKSLKIA